MITGNCGGERSGKGVLDTWEGTQGWDEGMQVSLNYRPKGFWAQQHRRKKVPIVQTLGELFEPVYDDPEKRKGLKEVVDNLRSDTLYVRHEFYTEVESRTMVVGGAAYRLAVLDGWMQIGKKDSSLVWDAQDYYSVDKRIRFVTNKRNEAYMPFHRRGQPFLYICHDRATRESVPIIVPEKDISWLYPVFDTKDRAVRRLHN